MRTMRRVGAVVATGLAALSIGMATGCADDAEDAAQQVTSAVGEGAEQVTSAAGEGAEQVTSAVGEGAEQVTSAAGEAIDGDEGAVIEIPAADGALAFAKTSVTAEAGTITLRMPNPSSTPHNISIDEPEMEEGDTVEKGGVSEVTADFPAGTYTYYCGVPGHREAGMEGTLTVQ